MELLHCEKLRKQKKELEKAEMDLVSVSQIEHKLWEMQKKSISTCTEALAFYSVPALHSFQGEYEFSPEILSAKLAEVVYRDATKKIKGRLFKVYFQYMCQNIKTETVSTFFFLKW